MLKGLHDFLADARRANDVVSIIRRDGLAPIHGYVSMLGGDLIVVAVVDENGRADGVSAIRADDVLRVGINASEHAKLAEPIEPLPIDEAAALAIESAITLLHRHYGLISVWMEREDDG